MNKGTLQKEEMEEEVYEEGERGGGWRREAGSAHQHHASVVLEVKRNSRADLLYRLEVRERGEERVEGGGVENRNGREEVLKEQRWKTKKTRR